MSYFPAIVVKEGDERPFDNPVVRLIANGEDTNKIVFSTPVKCTSRSSSLARGSAYLECGLALSSAFVQSY